MFLANARDRISSNPLLISTARGRISKSGLSPRSTGRIETHVCFEPTRSILQESRVTF